MFSAAALEGWSDYAHAYGYPSQASEKGDRYVAEVFSGTVPDARAIAWLLAELKELGINLIETDPA